MADIAFQMAEKVIGKLGSLAYQELGVALGVKSDLRKLERTIPTIRAVILDAEKKQATDSLLRLWLEQLNDVLHDAEDVLDEMEYRALRKKVVATYGGTSTKRGEDAHITHRLTHSFVHPSSVIGRDNDKENIIHLLMPPAEDCIEEDPLDCTKNLHVISIVGFGGLGKTTLAKWVYNDERIVGRFQLRMWVCVSEDFSVARLTTDILKSACGTIDDDRDLDNWDVDALQTRLRGLLKDKRFLLVLDDVWSEDRNNWLELRDLLIDGSEGSNIIVTTRSLRVASVMSSSFTYNLQGLSDRDCLSLFVKYAFEEGEDKPPQILFEIGKEIVKKCKGVPLAVTTLGSMLYSKVDEREWEFVRDNEIWQLEQKESDILPALRLSYDQMPIHLKRCFAFCSLFPKGHLFISVHLIESCMAHGLVLERSVNEKQELLDVGDLYIKELLSRSLFQDLHKICPSMPLYSFKMHDLIHDLAISVAQGECSVVKLRNKDITKTIRHLSFLERCEKVPKCLENLTKVRTVIFPGKQPMFSFEASISRFKYLRMLNLNGSSFVVLPSFIGTPKHLRYLSVCRNKKIKELPNSICKLHNLETLLLYGCTKLERLPKDIRNMINLRYLEVTTKDTCLLENGSVKSLSFLLVFRCLTLKDLFQGMDGNLTNLRSLQICLCISLTSLSQIMKHLTALENLIIVNCPNLSLMDIDPDLKLGLRHLVISNLPQLKVMPQWIQGSANTLQLLRIRHCLHLMALPEWLPTLKSLHTLEIGHCFNLSFLPEGTQHLTALRKLSIGVCPALSRKCQREDQPKIAHVPEVKFDEFKLDREYVTRCLSSSAGSTEEDDEEMPTGKSTQNCLCSGG